MNQEKSAFTNKIDGEREKQRFEPGIVKDKISNRLQLAFKLEDQIFQFSDRTITKSGNSVHGIGNKNRFRNGREAVNLPMPHGNAVPVGRKTVSSKNNSMAIIPRLDNCFTVAQYLIIDPRPCDLPLF
jgi:hypothetical protein